MNSTQIDLEALKVTVDELKEVIQIMLETSMITEKRLKQLESNKSYQMVDTTQTRGE